MWLFRPGEGPGRPCDCEIFTNLRFQLYLIPCGPVLGPVADPVFSLQGHPYLYTASCVWVAVSAGRHMSDDNTVTHHILNTYRQYVNWSSTVMHFMSLAYTYLMAWWWWSNLWDSETLTKSMSLKVNKFSPFGRSTVAEAACLATSDV